MAFGTAIRRSGALVGVASLILASVACHHVRREELASDLDELRAEMRAERQSADDELSGRVDGVEGRVGSLEQQQAEAAERMERLERDLQELEAEFGVTIERLENAIAFSVPVHFDFDSSVLDGAETPTLDRFASVYSEYYAGDLVTVEGFTDEAGSSAYNMRLGKRRAEEVKSYLTEVAGLDVAQVRTVSYGESTERLVAPGEYGDDAGRENRRVVLVIDHQAGATSAAVGGGQ